MIYGMVQMGYGDKGRVSAINARCINVAPVCTEIQRFLLVLMHQIYLQAYRSQINIVNRAPWSDQFLFKLKYNMPN